MAGKKKFTKRIIEAFRERRIQKRITFQKLSDIVGLNRSTLSNFESGHGHPSLESFVKWAKALDFEFSDIGKIIGEEIKQEKENELSQLEKDMLNVVSEHFIFPKDTAKYVYSVFGNFNIVIEVFEYASKTGISISDSIISIQKVLKGSMKGQIT